MSLVILGGPQYGAVLSVVLLFLLGLCGMAHYSDLPTLRLRRSSYNLLYKLRKAARDIEEDLCRIRESARYQTGKTFQWSRSYRGVWRLVVR